jgi:sarcosine oxidase
VAAARPHAVGSTTSRTAEVIVVGLGAMGAAVCLALADRGVRVIGIDRFQPPHPFGSTHGDTRITRLAIGEGPQYAPFVRRSHELWLELEQRSGAQLLTACGGVVLGPASSDFLESTVACARRFGVDHELLDAAELVSRFPMLAAKSGTEGYYEPGAGYVRPERAVDAALQLAVRSGAKLRLGERVRSWSSAGQGVEVRTDAETLGADALVLCAGAWITDLFPTGRELFTVYRQLLYWFPIATGFEQLREMPVFIWDLAVPGGQGAHPPCLYGFPAIDGRHGGLKVGTEVYERPAVPDGAQHPATRAESAAMYERYVASALPWLGRVPLRSASCLYTCTSSGEFVIDRHPECEAVVIVSACSGHGFKHSPAIGEAVAQLLVDGHSELELAPFSLRPGERS